MPRIVSGNTNAACVLIGEKGADMIIKEYGIKSIKKGKDELWNTRNNLIFIHLNSNTNMYVHTKINEVIIII